MTFSEADLPRGPHPFVFAALSHVSECVHMSAELYLSGVSDNIFHY